VLFLERPDLVFQLVNDLMQALDPVTGVATVGGHGSRSRPQHSTSEK
jgi:hypothetical protein